MLFGVSKGIVDDLDALGKDLFGHTVGFVVDVGPDSGQATTQLSAFTYLGKERTKAWIDSIYERYKDSIVLAGGHPGIWVRQWRPHSSSSPPIHPKWAPRGVPPKGTKVASVLGKGELLVRGSVGAGWFMFHLQGADTDKAADGMPLSSDILIYMGTRKVGKATLQSWAVPKPTTKEQFTDALAKGLVLSGYSDPTPDAYERFKDGLRRGQYA